MLIRREIGLEERVELRRRGLQDRVNKRKKRVKEGKISKRGRFNI